MKYLLLLIPLLFLGCFFPTGEYNFGSMGEAVYWVSENVDYVPDLQAHGVDEYWQTPEETLTLGTGDCEDYAILLMDIADSMGVQPWMVVLSNADSNHATVLINATVFEGAKGWYHGYYEYKQFYGFTEQRRYGLAAVKWMTGGRW